MRIEEKIIKKKLGLLHWKERMRAIFNSDAWKDYKHKDHDKVQAEVKELAEKIAKAGAKK